MTLDDIRVLADATLRPVLGERNVETIDVREQEDWMGDPALYIDVFVDPEGDPPDPGRWLTARHSLLDGLVAGGDRRFAFITLTDRQKRDVEDRARSELE